MWRGSIPFQERFPHLYKIKLVKSCILSDRVSANGFTWSWKQSPSTLSELHELLQIYKDIGDMNNSNDPSSYVSRFVPKKIGKYVVSGMRRIIDLKLILFKGLQICWSKLIPLKVRCFVWRVMYGRFQ